MENDLNDAGGEMRELARLGTLADAREWALVLASKQIAYRIDRDGKGWILSVDIVNVEVGVREIAAYLTESLAEDRSPQAGGAKKEMWSLILVAWIFLFLGVLQAERGSAWIEAGVLIPQKVRQSGEWWRLVTALTLHGDVPHLLANLGSGLLFGGCLIARVGQGVGWLLVMGVGIAANFCNVIVYEHQEFRSLGASGAVFGALALISGEALGDTLTRRSGRSWWRWVMPLGAGIALFAYLGTGGRNPENVDVLGHLWGFIVGLPMGLMISVCRVEKRVPSWGQVLSGGLAIALLAGAWFWAFHFGSRS